MTTPRNFEIYAVNGTYYVRSVEILNLHAPFTIVAAAKDYKTEMLNFVHNIQGQGNRHFINVLLVQQDPDFQIFNTMPMRVEVFFDESNQRMAEASEKEQRIKQFRQFIDQLDDNGEFE